MKHEGGRSFLERKQQELEQIINETDKKPLTDSYIRQWYNGKLDPNFYYSDKNDQLFLDKLFKELNDHPYI